MGGLPRSKEHEQIDGAYVGVDTLFKNIPYDEVWSACRGVGMSPELIGNEDLDVGTDGEKLKMSDRLCVCIVRALLHDVDFLLLSSVVDVLGQHHGRQALAYLRRYVQCRGLPDSSHVLPQLMRHRRLIIYATKVATLEEVCDARL